MIEVGCYISEDENILKKADYDICLENEKCYNFTFWKRIMIFNSCPSLISLDLLYISLFVNGADKLISRELAEDSWKRSIFLYIPVLNIHEWEVNKFLLEKMLSFLSGDDWKICFRKRNLSEYENHQLLRIKKHKQKKHSQYVDTVAMFSGGLDSFIGLIDCLEERLNRTIFVSHYGKGKGTKEYQQKLKEEALNKYLIEDGMFYSFHASIYGGIESTTRTRSFMFFSHAIAIASTYQNINTLLVPENGFISLNIPLTNSRIGSSSTRTTHPEYFEYFQQLLYNLSINIRIVNPYKFMTKGEMILQCKNRDFLQQNLNNTMSCSHPDAGRHRGNKSTGHCGNCLPCIIRKAAILKGKMVDTSHYYDLTGPTALINYNSYVRGVIKFDSKKAMFLIQKNGMVKENIEEYSAIYKRGMEEMKELLMHEKKI